MATIRLLRRACSDLKAILEDLEDRGSEIAARFTAEFGRKGQALAQFPESGRMRPDLGEGLRSTLVSPYVIVYRIEGGRGGNPPSRAWEPRPG